ncbi:hypothetical protein [Paenibacillus alvei]|uniref:hypothetical protein n=1 Tax=Paenibacillus alvei TaxID=44250 RepID=UPI0018CF48AC|nr:hypothetical protein [Paenibacillus alvei]
MKPTLTLEQSAALNSALGRYGKTMTLQFHAKNPNGWIDYMQHGALNDLDIMTLAAALTNGWEVEKSPIDILRETYALRWEESTGDEADSRARCYCAGVLEALRATGQVVEGINA